MSNTKRTASPCHLRALLAAAAAAAPLLGAFSQSASAAAVYWDPTNGTTAGTGSATPTGNWDTSSQWGNLAGTGAPAIWSNGGDNAVFAAGNDATGAYTVTITSAVTVAGITKEEGQPTITAATSLLTFFNNGLVDALAVDVSNTSSQQLTISMPFDNSPNGVITKTNNGLLFLGTNQGVFAGKFVVKGGTISVGSDTRWGVVPGSSFADEITLDGGSIRSNAPLSFNANRGITLGAAGGGFDGSNLVTWNGAITGNLGGPMKISSATQVLVLTNTNNNYDGATSFNTAGTITLGASEVIPNGSVLSFTAAGVFNLNGFDETVKSLSSTVATGVINLGSNTLTIDNPAGENSGTSFVGNGKVVKNGTGLQSLTDNSSSFTGEFDVNAGTVGIGQANCFGTGILRINGGAIANTATSGRAMTFQTLQIGGDFALNDSIIANPGTISLTGTTAVTLKSANPKITINTAGGGYTLTIAVPIGDEGQGRGFTKDGNGILVLNHSQNTYTGDTTIKGGLITVDGDGSLGNGAGTIHFAGGTLNANVGRTVPMPNPIDVTNSGTITTSTSAATPQFELSGPLIGGKTGTLTFRNDGADAASDEFQPRLTNGAFTFDQPIVISGGSLGKTRLSSFNTLSDGSGQTFSGVISGNGTFFRSASSPNTGGVTVLSGANNYTGGTTIVDGGIGVGSDTVGAITSGPVGTGTLTISPSGQNAYVFAIGTRTLANPITLNGSLGVQGSDNLTLSGNITSGVGAGLVKTGSGILVLTGSNNYPGFTNANGGEIRATTSANLGSTTNGIGFNGGQLTLLGPIISTLRNISANLNGGTISAASGNDSAFGNVTGTGTLTKADTGTVTVNFVRTTGASVTGGTLQTAASTSGGGTSVVSTLSTTGTGKFDLNDNKLVVNTPGSYGTLVGTNYTGVLGQVQGGRNNLAGAPQWNGTGIITSQTGAASGSQFTNLAVALASDAKGLTAGQTATFGGQTVGSTDTLVMYTWNGDANLSGHVDADDYFQIDSNYNKSGTSFGFFEGDFNYDGQINGDDYALIDAAYAGQGAAFPSAPPLGGVSAVPEPASLGGLGLVAAIGILRRRRRR